MLHRVILGSLERFIGALIEHYAGALPLWLAPVQVIIMPIKDEFKDYAIEIKNRLDGLGFRINLDSRSETLNKRIHDAESEKAPYILVVGQREINDKTVSVRKRGMQDLGSMSLEDFIKRLEEEVNEATTYGAKRT